MPWLFKHLGGGGGGGTTISSAMNKLTARSSVVPGKILSRIPLDFVHTRDIISLGHCMTKQCVLPGSMVMSKPWGGHE